jgi:TonB family protein
MHPRPISRHFLLFFLAMALLHGLAMFSQLKNHFSQPVTARPEPLKLKLVQETRPPKVLTKQQIVQSEDTEAPSKPVEKAFLSDKDRHFDRQTVARKIDTFKQAAQGNASVTQEAQKKKTESQKRTDFKDLKLSDIGMATAEPLPREVSRAPASLLKKGMENGDPTMDGLSATNDYVEEVALGDFTHLNTVEYKYYGFFHRIRQKLEQFWGKSIHEKAHVLFRSGRRLPANENLITSLQITLNADGEIIAVKIVGASGVKELDDAAIESFNQAGPFPNPPKDLLVNGKAVIQWGFVVKS